jgi:hypothetical protein
MNEMDVIGPICLAAVVITIVVSIAVYCIIDRALGGPPAEEEDEE